MSSVNEDPNFSVRMSMNAFLYLMYYFYVLLIYILCFYAMLSPDFVVILKSTISTINVRWHLLFIFTSFCSV